MLPDGWPPPCERFPARCAKEWRTSCSVHTAVILLLTGSLTSVRTAANIWRPLRLLRPSSRPPTRRYQVRGWGRRLQALSRPIRPIRPIHPHQTILVMRCRHLRPLLQAMGSRALPHRACPDIPMAIHRAIDNLAMGNMGTMGNQVLRPRVFLGMGNPACLHRVCLGIPMAIRPATLSPFPERRQRSRVPLPW